MDIYGIRNGISAMIEIFFRNSRKSGRTKTLISLLNEGDCVCFAYKDEADRVKYICEREKGIHIIAIVCDPKKAYSLVDKVRNIHISGKVLLDHTWVEQFFLGEIDETFRNFQNLQRTINKNVNRPELDIITKNATWKED